MINIAIIDQNETYRRSLKTILGQVEGFSVVLDSRQCSQLENSATYPFQVVFLDISLGRDKCIELVSEISAKSEHIRIIVLVMYRDELGIDFGKAITMLKNSGKKEFENCINDMLNNN
jgi:DNA-binding NarL/FixJ family response regulator